jgi:hypothetical protein
MHASEPTKKNPRIASYKVPVASWILCIFIFGLAACVRMISEGTIHQVGEFAIFAMFVVNTINFLVPLLKPNSMLGGAKLKTFVLAAFAFLAWTVSVA